MPTEERPGTLPESSSNLNSPESQPGTSRPLSDTSPPHEDQPTLLPDPRHPIGSPHPRPVAPGFDNPAKAHPAISPISSVDSEPGPSNRSSNGNSSQYVPEVEEPVQEDNESSNNSHNDLPEMQEPQGNNEENNRAEIISISEAFVGQSGGGRYYCPLIIVLFLIFAAFFIAMFSYSVLTAKDDSNENHTGGLPFSATPLPIEQRDSAAKPNETLIKLYFKLKHKKNTS